MGRPVQTVQKAITPGTDVPARKDLVTLQQYDSFGRQSSTWLLTAIAGNNGAYADTLSIMNAAKTTNTNSGMSDRKPYSYPVYEVSPLNRIVKQFGPGADWQKNGKSIRTGYLTNLAKSGTSWLHSDSLVCGLYKTIDDRKVISLSRTANYEANQLYVTRLKDENGNESYEFKNKQGLVVLTRQINDGKLYDTNFIYDSFGNLRAVFPPKLPTDY